MGLIRNPQVQAGKRSLDEKIEFNVDKSCYVSFIVMHDVKVTVYSRFL